MSNIFENEKVVISPTIVSKDRIENLSDRPNLAVTFGGDGMTAKDLKKSFDKIGVYIATRLKNLIDALKTSDAGESIGITDWDDLTQTNIKSCLNKLKTSLGASIIGTGKSINGVNANLQQVIDDLYSIIVSYELDDIRDIKTALGYVESTGESETFNLAKEDIATLKEIVEKLRTLFGVNALNTRSTRLENIESDITTINESLGSPNGVATLNNSGKVHQEIDASKITSGILPLSVIPDAAFERTVFVNSENEMYALTTAQVQNGDIVVVNGNTDRWFKVINDANLSTSDGYREIIGGTTAIAQMAKEYDPNFSGANSIYSKLSSIEGSGRTNQNVKKNADDILALGGNGRSTETVKGNADAIVELNSTIANINGVKADKTSLKHLDCVHSKSGTVHTFTLNSGSSFLINVTEYSIRAKMTANVEIGDTITITDNTTSFSGILPKDSVGKSVKLIFSSGIYPIIDFTVDLGGSEKHAFFKSSESAEVGDLTFSDMSDNADYTLCNGNAKELSDVSIKLCDKYKVGFSPYDVTTQQVSGWAIRKIKNVN